MAWRLKWHAGVKRVTRRSGRTLRQLIRRAFGRAFGPPHAPGVSGYLKLTLVAALTGAG
jgi:hypothetical protein